MRALAPARPTRRIVTICAGLLVTSPLTVLPAMVAADTRPLDLQAVLARTTVTPPARVGFYEERHNPMLDAPLVLTGYIEYLEAGVLRKIIKTPFEEAFLIAADHITIERDGESHILSLNKSRSLQTILAAIEAILAGEAGKLEAVFSYELSGTSNSWTVLLTPISSKISKRLTSLQVDGDDRSATRIRVDLKDGEWHRMDILRDDPKQ